MRVKRRQASEGRHGVAGALGKVGWKILGYGFAIPTGIALRKAMDAAWQSSRGTAPPKNPAAPGTQWQEALAWAAVSGIAVAIGRMLAAQGAASTYKTLTGHLPPGLESEGP